ncbi:MAG: LacI family DNA-binding transcriptional regulator [Clostridia bacterium]|nr:LacI family DNA-binding transcriptional regulator [Clostridia bacterium]
MNIMEFAKIAGVSRSAVSRYFNDGYLSGEKRKKIEDAIEKTGYSPSVSARNVSRRVTKLVGVILPKLSSESCARVTEGISEVLDKEGYKILLVNTANDSKRETEALELFRTNRVDGVILLATVFSDIHKAVLNKMRVPVIIVGQHLKGFSCITHNDKGAAFALTKLMLDKGAKRPAMIAVTRDDVSAGAERLEGYKRALKDVGVEFDKKYVEYAEFTMESGYKAAKRQLLKEPRPDCILCATDNIAAGAALYCRSEGIKIPEDLMICGVGNSKMGRAAYPSITSARLHYKTAGAEAATMLLSAVKHRDSIQRTLELDYDIVERESTGGKCEIDFSD